MWIYEKRLEYPVNITKPDPRMAKLLMAQYGGPDSELGAGLRYLTQRFSMPDDRIRATLNDIGTEEIAHWEMIGTMITQRSTVIHQCMQGATCEELKAAGLDGYYVVHSHGVFPRRPERRAVHNGVHPVHGRTPSRTSPRTWRPEQKARATYEHLMNMTRPTSRSSSRCSSCASVRSCTTSALANASTSCENLAAPACACRCPPPGAAARARGEGGARRSSGQKQGRGQEQGPPLPRRPLFWDGMGGNHWGIHFSRLCSDHTLQQRLVLTMDRK